jgi:hypothetical protein
MHYRSDNECSDGTHVLYVGSHDLGRYQPIEIYKKL